MLAVEKAGDYQVAWPAKLLGRLCFEHGGLERHAPRVGGLDVAFKLLTGLRRAVHTADKGIPVRVRGKIGQDPPHLFRRSLDFDLCEELACQGSPSFRGRWRNARVCYMAAILARGEQGSATTTRGES